MEPWPAERIKRSRFIQYGSDGLNLRNFCHKTYKMSAAPRHRPGWPDFAFSTLSAESTRTQLVNFCDKTSSLSSDTFPPPPYKNRLNSLFKRSLKNIRPQGDSHPCRSLERAVS